MLDLIRAKVARQGLTNVTLVQGRPDDPVLPAATFDVIVMVDVYHELASPQIFVRKLREALKPGGRLVLIEFRLEDPRVPIREVHKMSVSQVREELGADGFQNRQGDRRPAVAAHHRAQGGELTLQPPGLHAVASGKLWSLACDSSRG